MNVQKNGHVDVASAPVDYQDFELNIQPTQSESTVPSSDLSHYILDEEVNNPFTLDRPDTLAYAKWALYQPSLSIKMEAMDELLNECEGIGPSYLERVIKAAEELHFNILKAAEEAGSILPVEWLRKNTRRISDLLIKANYYGFSSQIKDGEEAREHLIKQAAGIYNQLEILGIRPIYDSTEANIASSFFFDPVAYIKKVVPIDLPQTNWRAVNPKWFVVKGSSLEEAGQTGDLLDDLCEDLYRKPYQIREYNGFTYIRLDAVSVYAVNSARKRFEMMAAETNAGKSLIARAKEIASDFYKISSGLIRHHKEQERFLSELEHIKAVAYDNIKYAINAEMSPLLASSGGSPVGQVTGTAYSSWHEAEFERGVLMVEDAVKLGEYERALGILRSIYFEINIEEGAYSKADEKRAALLQSMLEIREMSISANLGRLTYSMEKLQLDVMNQLKDVEQLEKEARKLGREETDRYLFIAAGYRAKAYEAVGNLDAAVAATDPVVVRLNQYLFVKKRAISLPVNSVSGLAYIFQSATGNDDFDKNMDVVLELGAVRARIIRGQANKFSRVAEDPDEDKFEKKFNEVAYLITVLEEVAASTGKGTADYIAGLREIKAALLWMDNRWKDLAIYVRDEIDKPFWNSRSSVFLRESILSYIPGKLRGVDGRIPEDIDEVDWDDIGDRMDAMLRAASGHLFDHPWYVQLGIGITGCAVGTAVADGPWGCPIGAAVAVAGDLTASAFTNKETWQSFYAGYSSTDWNQAAINYSLGAGAVLLNAVGFKTNFLPLNRWGTALGKGATWQKFASKGWRSVKDVGTVLGESGLTIGRTGKFIGKRIYYGVNRKAAQKAALKVAEEAVAKGTASAPSLIDPKLVDSAMSIWRILAGKARDLGPVGNKLLRVKLASFFRLIKWDPVSSQFLPSGIRGTVGGLWDLLFHSSERLSVPYLLARKIFPNPYKENEDSITEAVFKGMDAFAKMFFATRIGVDYLGIDKGGTRLMFLMDRIQDIIMQGTSGKVVTEIDWDKAAMNYISGSIPGQIRGRWLKNFEGRLGSLTKGLEIKLSNFSSGKLAWESLTEAEQAVVRKLLPLANLEGVIVVRKMEDGVIKALRQTTIGKKIVGNLEDAVILTDDEWRLVSRLLRPLEFRMAEFSNTSSVYRHYLAKSAGSGAEAERAKGVVAVLDKMAGMAASKGDDVVLVIRNHVVYVKKGKKLLKVGGITREEQHLVRSVASPVEYHLSEFVPGSGTFETLKPKQKDVVGKLFKMGGNDPGAILTVQGGRVTMQGFLGEVGLLRSKTVGILTSPEEEVLRVLMASKFPKLSLTAAGEKGLRIKFASSLNWKGIMLFCAIHDALLGTVYDEIRGRILMDTDPYTMGTATFIRSLTTLWPREILKLHFGWDKKLAVFLDRLFGREFLDPLVTKWVNLWPSKGYWREVYDKSFKSGSVTDFIDYHVAPGWFEGGLFVFNKGWPFVYLFNRESEHTPNYAMPGSFGTLAKFYADGKMKKKRRLTDEEYMELDQVVNKMLNYVEIVLRDKDGSKRLWIEDDYYREDVLINLGLGVAAAAYVAHQEKSELFSESISSHPELFNFIDYALKLVADDGRIGPGAVENFMDEIVDDGGSYKMPKILEEYKNSTGL